MKYDPWKVQAMLDNLQQKFQKNSYKGYMNFFTWEELQEIWLISDTHFWHKNIIEYCGRPQDWQEMCIKNWNDVIKNDDTVLHLGDFSLGNKEMTKEVASMLNGKIYMIGGNHDRHGKKWFKDVGIIKIGPFVVHSGGKEDDKIVYFTHKPLQDNNLGEGCYCIHGHWHQKSLFVWEGFNGCKYMNVSVEQMHYKPRKFKNLLPILVGLQSEKGMV